MVEWNHDWKELSVRAMENMVGVAMANPPAEGMGRSFVHLVLWSGGENGEVLDNTMIVAGIILRRHCLC